MFLDREKAKSGHKFPGTFSFFDILLAQVHLGDLYNEIACYAEALPRPVTSPLHSFAGFVLNLNIAAKVHRDVEDVRLCLILWAEICASTSPGLCFSCAPKMP